MRIVIVGGHGQIARQLSRRLSGAGHEPIALLRNPDHCGDVRADGAEPVVLDLERGDVHRVEEIVHGADAVVFAAGAGPDSGPERKLTLDRDGLVLVADGMLAAGVRRLLVVSSMGADDFDADSSDTFQVYLRAKSEGDAAVRERDLDWTIVRPGSLTDDEAADAVEIAESVEAGSVPRADIAHVLHALLETGAGVHRTIEVVGGSTPVSDAVSAL